MTTRWQHVARHTAHLLDVDHLPAAGEQLHAACGAPLDISPRDVGRSDGVPCTDCDLIEEALDVAAELVVTR